MPDSGHFLASSLESSLSSEFLFQSQSNEELASPEAERAIFDEFTLIDMALSSALTSHPVAGTPA
jgi:hypothetical protein